MVWDAVVVLVIIVILAPPAALFRVLFHFAIHTIQRITSDTKPTLTLTLTLTATAEKPASAKKQPRTSSERVDSFADVGFLCNVFLLFA